jgi:hypothetical protein
MGLTEFIRRYSDEAQPRELFAGLRLHSGVECPGCGFIHHQAVIRQFRISCQACNKRFSLTAATVMHGSNFPIALWLLAIYLLSGNRKMTSTLLASLLGVQQRTGWTVRERVYDLMDAEPWARGLCDMDIEGVLYSRLSADNLTTAGASVSLSSVDNS